jgi:hypothetical protein
MLTLKGMSTFETDEHLQALMYHAVKAKRFVVEHRAKPVSALFRPLAASKRKASTFRRSASHDNDNHPRFVGHDISPRRRRTGRRSALNHE